MKKVLGNFLGWIVLLPVLVIMAVFAIANRRPVTIDFDPLPVTMEMPLFLLVFGIFLLGVLGGGGAAWWRQRHWRQEARRLKRQGAKEHEATGKALVSHSAEDQAST